MSDAAVDLPPTHGSTLSLCSEHAQPLVGTEQNTQVPRTERIGARRRDLRSLRCFSASRTCAVHRFQFTRTCTVRYSQTGAERPSNAPFLSERRLPGWGRLSLLRVSPDSTRPLPNVQARVQARAQGPRECAGASHERRNPSRGHAHECDRRGRAEAGSQGCGCRASGAAYGGGRCRHPCSPKASVRNDLRSGRAQPHETAPTDQARG